MRASISVDRNNVDEIGSANNPGLRVGQLTRAQHRARLAGAYRGRLEELEKLLDTLYGVERPLTGLGAIPLSEMTCAEMRCVYPRD